MRIFLIIKRVMTKTIAALFLLGSVAGAVPINYTILGTGSGYIYSADPLAPGAVLTGTFTAEPFSLDFLSDTSDVKQLNGFPGVYENYPMTQAEMTLGALASPLTPSASPGLFDDGRRLLLFSYAPLNATMELDNPIFDSYNLTTAIGPISVSVVLNPELRGPSAQDIDTNFGTVLFSDVSNVTFSAELATPEPASLTMIGLGFVGLWLFRYRAIR
jgi:hypothetical protein